MLSQQQTMAGIRSAQNACKGVARATPNRLAAVQRQNRRPTHVQAASAPAGAATATQLSLHLGETTLQVPFTPQQAKTLDAELSKLLQTFADKQAAPRPKRWDALEVRFTSEQQPGLELLELFCNPNTYKTAFDAKLLITARATGLKVMCEGRLSSIKADVDAYLADHSD